MRALSYIAVLVAVLQTCTGHPVNLDIDLNKDVMDELEGELDVIKKELDSVISDSKLEERVSDPQDSEAMFADVIETNKKKIDQHELFEGDIMLAGKNTVYTALMSKAAAANIQHGDVITDTSRKWDMPIRYAYHSSLGSDPPSEFGSDGAKAKYGWELAIADLAKQTNGCFSFEKVSVNDPRKHLRIVSEGGCWSYIGDVKSMHPAQKLSLARGCHHATTAMHELFHALGFWHEQSRRDRDKYVNIIWSNIPSQYQSQFQVTRAGEAHSLGFPYDYVSVMHYHKTAFNSQRQTTIQVKIPNELGYDSDFLGRGYKNNDLLSPTDLDQVKALYCPNTPTQPPTKPPTNPPTQPPTRPPTPTRPTAPPTKPPVFNCSGVDPVSPDGKCVDKVPFCHLAQQYGWCDYCHVQQKCLQTCKGPDATKRINCVRRKNRGWCDATKWQFRRWRMDTKCRATCQLNQC